MPISEFRKIASRYGVEPSYVDTEGKTHEARPEVLEAVIQALDISLDLIPKHADLPKENAFEKAVTFPQGESRWGVFLPLYALHSGRSWGTGDFTDLEGLAAWVGDLGGRVVGTLPLLASFLDEPFSPSPYAPVSRLFWNEFFIDPERIFGFHIPPEAPAFLERLRREPLVDYREGMRLKRGVLEAQCRSFFAIPKDSREEFEVFLKDHPRVEDYARFRAAREKRDEAVRYHLFVQWIADRQLRAAAEAAKRKNVDLFLDFPLGVHPDGYDLWRFRDLFVSGLSVGAPPDPFFAEGQNWGFPPLHPFKLREGGLSYFAECLRHHLQYARLLRIDHVMSFHRLFVIPNGCDAADGVYLRYPAQEFYQIVCDESRRYGSVIVGEDLGTVPPEVRPAMERNGLLRSYVLPFETDENAIPADCAASLNTHDMLPFAAGTGGRDDVTRALRLALAKLAGSKAALVLVNLEDLWLETEPQNRPGTGDEFPNWRRKARLSFEEFSRDPFVCDTLREIDRLRKA